MKFDENLAAIHGYLCADGYVIKNPKNQKHKYYHIGLRNTSGVLLKDFQEKFNKIFGVLPIITNDSRCRIQSRKIFEKLTKDYSYYSYEWRMPALSKPCLKLWLRAYFDCEGWVELQKGKSRAVRADCVNYTGLKAVQSALSKFGIVSTVNKRSKPIWRLNVCGLDDIKNFQKHIGFLHPDKALLLNDAIESYKSYEWKIPEEKHGLEKFIKKYGKHRKSRNEIRFFSIKQNNVTTLKKSLENLGIESSLHGPWKNNHGTCYYSLILKLDDVRRLEE